MPFEIDLSGYDPSSSLYHNNNRTILKRDSWVGVGWFVSIWSKSEKWTYWQPWSLQSGKQMHHQWVEGNLPVSSKCVVCDKNCGSVLRLQDWRCLWCRATVHTTCRSSYIQHCSLGPTRHATVPPTKLIKFPGKEVSDFLEQRRSAKCSLEMWEIGTQTRLTQEIISNGWPLNCWPLTNIESSICNKNKWWYVETCFLSNHYRI